MKRYCPLKHLCRPSALFMICVLHALLARSAPADTNTVNVAILTDGNTPYFTQINDLMKSQLNILTLGEWTLNYVESPEYCADWNPERAGQIMQDVLSDTNIHLVFANGLLVSRQASQAPTPPNKPVISGFVDDPATLELPISPDGTSTVTNYTFVVIPCDAQADLELFRQLVPFKRLAVLVDEYYTTHLPEMKTRAAAYEKQTGIHLDLVPYRTTAAETMKGLPNDVQAVYITPSVILSDDELTQLIQDINARKLPSFSMMGLADVERGVMAGQRSTDPIRVIRRMALNMQQILMGTPPEKLPVLVDDPLRTVLNAKTARQIGASLPYGIMLTAQILHADEMEIGKPVNLSEAYQLTLENNPGLAAGQEEVNKSAEDRIKARSSLFPQLTGNLQTAQIDEDRARASMGMQPWKSTSGGLGLTQIIFNDPAITAFRSYSRIYQSRKFEQTNLELDTLFNTGQAYVNLLTKRALLQIDMDNYNLIQHNLDLARNRRNSGVAGPEEIYRWETQLTTARSSLLSSHAQLSIAQTLLNQAMGMDADDQWNPADENQLTAQNPFFKPGFTQAVENDTHFTALRSFLLNFALQNAPELQALDFAIEAQGLLLNQYKRRFIVPAVGVSLDYDHTFDQTLAETDEPSPITFPEADDDNWTAALVASWPLFEGGGKAADLRKARAELNRLRELRAQTEQAVIQRLYEALYAASSSSPNIDLTRQAAEYARKNLNVVQEKYAQGTVSIIDLLDAQNEVFQQEQRSALARYEFMLDVIRAQRATAWIPELHSADERALWISEMNKTIQQTSETAP